MSHPPPSRVEQRSHADRKRRAWLRLAFCAAIAAGSVFAADETPVALPPFIVEEATKGPPWRYAEWMGYEILSRCDDGVTRRVIEAHHRLHQLLGQILPPQFHVAMSVPRAVILYDEELQPAASREVIARMLRPTPDLTPEEAPVMAGLGGRGGLRLPATRRYSFLPNLRLWDRDGMAVFMIVRRNDFDADRLALTPDYVSFVIKSRLPYLPPWFVHGFLGLYGQVSFGSDRLTVEPMQWISPSYTDAVKKDPKTASGVLPLEDFLNHRLGPRDPAVPYEPINAWQAQAALFVRWGVDPAGGARREALWKFAERSAREGVSEQLFRDCFEMDFAAAQAELVAYLPQAVRRTLTFRAKFPKPPPLPLRNASDGQIARLKGDWERLEVPYVKSISPDLAAKYLEQARRTLKRGYERGERDPRLLAVLGLCEVDAGDEAAAREYLEAGIRIGQMRPRALYELARLRFAEFRAAPAGKNGGLDVTQTAAVLGPLFDARAQQPPLPEVYDLIAEVWAATDSTPTRGHLLVLHEGVRYFTRRTSLVLRAAELNLRHGFREEAEALVQIGVQLADDDASRQRVAALQTALATK